MNRIFFGRAVSAVEKTLEGYNVKDKIGDENVRQSMCMSNIFNISAINKVISTPNLDVHTKYKTSDGNEVDLENPNF